MNAVYFISKLPSYDLLIFANSLNEKIKTYVLVDDNHVYFTEFKHLIIQINNLECESKGFRNTCYLNGKNTIMAWEKINYVLCRKHISVNFAWIIEDDVLIPSLDSVLEMTEKYSEYDLITADNTIRENPNRKEWHWKKMPPNFPKPWVSSMCCAMGISRNLLNVINEYVLQHKTLLFLEFMYNTFCYHKKLKQISAPELSTIIYRKEWSNSDFEVLPNNWFHPVKNRNIHKQILNITDNKSGYFIETIDREKKFIKNKFESLIRMFSNRKYSNLIK